MRIKKGLRTGLLLLVIMLASQTYTVMAAQQNQVVTEATAATAKKGLVKSNGRYYYYKNGKKIKNTWKRVQGKRYYFQKNGAATVGVKTVGGKLYLFSERGVLKEGTKTRVVNYKNRKYYVKKNGSLQTGWLLKGNGKLYYFSPRTGRMYQGNPHGDVNFTAEGYAKPNETATQLKIQTMRIVASITNENMSKSQKLSACFNFISSGRNFSYMTWRDYSYYNSWKRDYAYEMLSKRRGNCYNFAAGFAYLAKEVGYDVYVVRGRVGGSRDHAADGFTRHAWVRINGLNYDPEAQFAGWARGIYGSAGYPVRHQITSIEKI